MASISPRGSNRWPSLGRSAFPTMPIGISEGNYHSTSTDMGEKEDQEHRPARARLWRSPRRRGSRRRPTGAGAPRQALIAVLPFKNMSGDAEQEYFADGIVRTSSPACPHRVAFVIARNSTFTYKGRAVDVTQVGRELGVRYVLEGSVRKSGRSRAHHRAAHRRGDRRPCLGRALRPQSTIFSPFRTRSHYPSSAPSSRAYAWPKPNASNANDRTASMPMILFCKPSPTSIRECQRHR